MFTKTTAFVSIAMLAVLLSVCKKEPPKCSDKETLTLVRTIILDQVGGAGNLNEKEIEETVKLEHPRASAYDDKIGKYSCEATLVFANAWRLPTIKYESQLDDDQKHLVMVGGFLRGDLWRMASALQGVKEKKAMEKEEND